MTILQLYYKIFKSKKEIPYYAKYSLLKIIWKPIRKYLNVVVIPNIPFNFLRIFLYRFIGYKIGKNVFIGMKCYLDDLEPHKTIIEDNVVISYGVYFSLHGKGQTRTSILIKEKAYIGMCSRIVARKNGLVIGKNSVVGACSVVINDVGEDEVNVGNPAKKLDKNK